MNDFQKKAYEWASRYGGTDGCEEKAYLAGVKEALNNAMMLCHTGQTPGMIRMVLHRWVNELEKKKHDPA